MRVELDQAALIDPIWPDGIGVERFAPRFALELHSLLAHAYRNGGGGVEEYETWLPRMTSDAEFDRDLWFLAAADGALVGAALCWTSAFVKDLVVHESWRRRGLGEALLRRVFVEFSTRGHATVELKVRATNAAAIRFYERAGMQIVERPTRD